ncbi:MAG: bifunctional 2-polyprenyl-6-hydroxyphenol methylase/3-demethylubiquinol 3-O-methyltransferase UbiG [Candidatus Accumulibacter sp.]|jgi:2-polyprenyl-6-hydroxyphenyl methylase/3-demethylubiquinone-9 3-methyltransferase|nr:bifunctional 2-polyprenyl-6-hydroxyphenol methylase/3-demethylubiquinol 3-O-methyltransferase UbiG [Accumulibacter sp.]
MPPNADPLELERFGRIAHGWWDPDGQFKPLHRINRLRADWIAGRADLAGKAALDVGCGGGLLSEALAGRGARTTGIDLSAEALEAARIHLFESGAAVDYRRISAEELARETPGAFDVVACMEMLEHVPDPQSAVAACAALVKSGGHVFFSTLNRHPKAYLYAIVGAERVLGLLPGGTHTYARFIKPSELTRWARDAGLETVELTGYTYNPVTATPRLSPDTRVNYLMHAVKA